MTDVERLDHSEAMLTHGWTVRPIGRNRFGGPLHYEWRSPRGISGSDYQSTDGLATEAAIRDALTHQDYPRTQRDWLSSQLAIASLRASYKAIDPSLQS